MLRIFRTPKFVPVLCSFLLTSFPTVIVHAAEEDSAVFIEEIIVTARKRSENIQDVPIAVTAFTAKTIERAGIERPKDFIMLTPNVSIVDTANVGDTQVTIRGQVSTRDAESTFAYVVDGVLITNPNGFNEELFDIQQIEVLKGPQGALYGRNAVAGAIIVNTKKPTNETEAQIKVGGGTNDLVKTSAMISGALIDDVLTGRLAVSYRDTDGEFDHDFKGDGDVDYLEDTTIRGRLVWTPTEKLEIDTQLTYTEVDAGAINFNAVFAFPTLSGFPDGNSDVNDHKFKYIFNVPAENEQEQTFFSLKADYELDWARLTTVVAYDDLDEDLLSDGTSAAFNIYDGLGSATEPCTTQSGVVDTSAFPEPFASLSAAFGFPLFPPYSQTACNGYQYQERNQDSLTLELRLTSPEDQALRWIAGMYYADIDREVVVSYGADLGAGFSKEPYVAPSGADPTDLLFWDDFDTDVLSAFGQVEMDLTESQELAFALRWDHEEREVSNKVPHELSPNNNNTTWINPFFDENPTATSIPDSEKTFVQFQPKVSWNWQVEENYSVYATYGVGFRSGGFNSQGTEALIIDKYTNEGFTTEPQNQRDDYDKEVSKSFEIGLKSEWLDRRLRVNAAIFTTDVDDYQFFNFYAGDFGILRTVNNVDEVSIEGFEVDATLAMSENVMLYGSYGFIDSEIDENKNRPYTEGNDVPLAPDSTANLGVQIEKELADDLKLVTRVDWRYTGSSWFHTVQNNDTDNSFQGFFGQANFKNTERDAFDVLNLRISLETQSWMLTAWGANIRDEEYLEEVIPAPEFGGSFIHQANGEAYGVDFLYRF